MKPVALVPYVFAVAAVAAGVLWHAADGLPRLGRTIGQGAISLGGPYALTGTDGRMVHSSDFLGRYQLIYFGYSYCPDVCPITLSVMTDALAKLGAQEAQKIVPVFITVDPERDTAPVLKRYMTAFDPRFVALTGDVQRVAGVGARYRVYAKKTPLPGGGYGMDHSNVLYLLGPDGSVANVYTDTMTPDALAEDLRARLR